MDPDLEQPTLETLLRLMPKDGIFRPKECFWLSEADLIRLLNAGMIEVDGREFYRAVK